MKTVQKFGAVPILALTLGLGVAGLYLRVLMLGGQKWAYPALWVISVVAIAALAGISVLMGKRNEPEKNFSKDLPAGWIMLLGAGMAFVSHLMTLLNTPDLFDTAAAALGLVGAVCLGLQGRLRMDGKVSAPAGMVAALSLAVCHLSSFRHWSSDPLLGDYCFRLLAGVFAMLATYNLAGFPLGLGKRRLSLFYTHCAMVFCLISLADSGVGSKLFYGGVALWLLAGSCTRKMPASPRRKLGGGYVEEVSEED